MTDVFSPIIAALASYRYVAHDEHRLYEGLSLALTSAGIEFERERSLLYPDGKRGRLDYYLPVTRLAIEVKVRGSAEAVLRQITMYARHEDVAAVLLVTSLGRLARVPEDLFGKPARSYRLTGAFG